MKKTLFVMLTLALLLVAASALAGGFIDNWAVAVAWGSVIDGLKTAAAVAWGSIRLP